MVITFNNIVFLIKLNVFSLIRFAHFK